MKYLLASFASLLAVMTADAQTLTLDSCRAMALRNNKQLTIARTKQEVAKNVRKSARTKYLPNIDIAGGWMLSSKEISILNNDQKAALNGLGSTVAAPLQAIGQQFGAKLEQMAQGGIISPDLATGITQLLGSTVSGLEQAGNALGAEITDAFRTDTRSIIAGSVMVNQPLYMGGAITAGNKMADIAEHIAALQTDASEQNVIQSIDEAYWMVVSLQDKQKLAGNYLSLVEKLNSDVHKMIENGVATRADGLKVDVRVNEAEMAKTQVDNGLALSKMLLCQLCGLPLDSDIRTADETAHKESVRMAPYSKATAMEMRPELQMLQAVVGLSEAETKMARAGYLPKVLLTGGYMISNPNGFNGFEKKFSGMWNVGLMVHIPVLDWGSTMYKVRASKLGTNLARLEYDEAREMIDLQITQCEYKLKEAQKRLSTAEKNIQRAEENLRCANLGFKEGVMQTTEVMAAQTAWMQAQTQKVDADIDVRLSETRLQKALGVRSF